MQKSQLWTMRVKSSTLKSFTQYSATFESLVWAKSEAPFLMKVDCKVLVPPNSSERVCLMNACVPCNWLDKVCTCWKQPVSWTHGEAWRSNVVSLLNTVDIAKASAGKFGVNKMTKFVLYIGANQFPRRGMSFCFTWHRVLELSIWRSVFSFGGLVEHDFMLSKSLKRSQRRFTNPTTSIMHLR